MRSEDRHSIAVGRTATERKRGNKNVQEEFYIICSRNHDGRNARRNPACVAAEEKANASAKTGKTGREAAIDAALSHAGFDADQVSGLRCEKDYDDGREIYEVEFRHGGYEYSYDIDAHS